MNATILEYLKNKGEQMDADVARALDVPPAVVRKHIAELSSSGELISCQVTRYEGSRKVEGVACRLAGYTPRWSHGRKPGAKRKPPTPPKH
jgi:predicted transcriptional regulator